MAHLFVFLCFAVLSATNLFAARAGRRGDVGEWHRGPGIPARVMSDPALRREANRLVAFWCTGAGLLGAAPLVPVGLLVLDGENRGISTWGLLGLVAYGTVVVTVALYPYEKIESLGSGS